MHIYTMLCVSADLALFGCHRYMNDPVMVDLVSERSLVPESVVHEVRPYLETTVGRISLVNLGVQ